MKLFKYFDFIKKSKWVIDSMCRNYNIQNYTINKDGSIDVNGDVNLNSNKLSRIPLKFRNVSGYFDCSDNKLISLEGCPQSIGGSFNCSRNQLISLVGCPQSIGGDFSCSENKLSSLEFSPQSIGGIFDCRDNKITGFKGFPEYFENYFSFFGNPVYEILKLFKSRKKSIYWIMEHDVIQGNKIILRRLEEVAYELKMNLPKNIKLENYILV